MEGLTYSIDKDRIRKGFWIAFAIYSAALALILGVSFGILQEALEIDSKTIYDVAVFDWLILSGVALSASIVISVGVTGTYTDCFRIQRSYSYQIRKKSVIRYAPVLGIVVTIIKVVSFYPKMSSYSYLYLATFILFLYAFYVLFIASFVLILSFYRFWLISLLYVFVPLSLFYCTLFSATWIRAYFFLGQMPVLFGATCVMAIVFVASLFILKKRLMTCNLEVAR